MKTEYSPKNKKRPGPFSSLTKFMIAIAIVISLFSAFPVDQASARRGGGRKPQPPPPTASAQPYNLVVNRDGIYRVTYEELLAAGMDLTGEKSANLALTNHGAPVPIFVQPNRTFGPGGFIEFFGQASDSLYTRDNVYVLQVDRSLTARIASDGARIPRNRQPADYYMETVTIDDNYAYDVASPTGDPWYHSNMLVNGSPKNWNFDLTIDDYVPGAAPSSLDVRFYGGYDWPASPDHHVVVAFNGVTVADALFDGLTEFTATASDAPVAGEANTLSLTMPSDLGLGFDIVNLESFSLTYPRAFVARDGSLTFSASGDLFRVDNLPSQNVVVYSLDGNTPTRLRNISISEMPGAYSATFAGSRDPKTYIISTVQSLLKSVVAPSRSVESLTSMSAEYLVDLLIISHPDFLSGLGPFVQARQARGLGVRVVDVTDIYASYSYGIVDPQAIRQFITYAKNNLGTRYVLLVGGDTYDYMGYQGSGARSFIPTLYAETDAMVKFAPVDPLLADTDGDNLPDLALGRFPVRTIAELEAMISKTLAYESRDYNGTALFSADRYYTSYADTFVATMPENWASQKVYLDEIPEQEARDQLMEAMNTGVALANYVGHSSEYYWSSPSFFTSNDAALLSNPGRPVVVAQYGCWNTYFVEPGQNDFAQLFLLSADRGAAALMGTTTLAYIHSLREYGQILTPKLVQPGMTIGDAILQAKQELASYRPTYPEIYLGWTLLGDPTMVVQP